MEEFFEEMRAERAYQQKKWGDEFDSKNTANDWVAYIAAYLGKAVTFPWDSSVCRTSLVKVATLCMAAVEWIDSGKMPKRHYDK